MPDVIAALPRVVEVPGALPSSVDENTALIYEKCGVQDAGMHCLAKPITLQALTQKVRVIRDAALAQSYAA